MDTLLTVHVRETVPLTFRVIVNVSPVGSAVAVIVYVSSVPEALLIHASLALFVVGIFGSIFVSMALVTRA